MRYTNILKSIILLALIALSSSGFARTVSDILSQYDTPEQIELEAQQGSAQAQHDLGSLHWSGGSSPYPFDQGKAFELHLRAAGQGYAPAQHTMCTIEEIFASNDKEAVRWCTLAAEQGYAKSQHNLAHKYITGEGVLKDYNKAINWFTLAAEQGYARSQNQLGMYYKGWNNAEVVPKDYREAFKWYRKSAEQGDAEGQFNLAIMYRNGEGILKNEEEAVKWLKKAYKQNYKGALQELLRNDKEAFNHYLKSAEQGDAFGQYNLGWRYASGTGVLKDLYKAKHWLNQAYENPNADTQTIKQTEELWNSYELWKY